MLVLMGTLLSTQYSAIPSKYYGKYYYSVHSFILFGICMTMKFPNSLRGDCEFAFRLGTNVCKICKYLSFTFINAFVDIKSWFLEMSE